jgi:hypothetical protein
LRAATVRAAGHLETLDVSGRSALSHGALLAVVTANSASLRELHMGSGRLRSGWPVAEVEALLRAAPGLRACHAAVRTDEVAVARSMLRAEPPFAALRLELLTVGGGDTNADGDIVINADAVLALAADLTVCPFIRQLVLWDAALHAPVALDALVDAALACRLHTLRLIGHGLRATSAPALARLLGGGALAELEVLGAHDLFLDAPAAEVLANALRACSTLTALRLGDMNLWQTPGTAAAVLGALTGHSSLRTLDLSYHLVYGADSATAGAAFGALVGANAPALTELDLSSSHLRDAELRPLFDALPANTHLRTLECGDNNGTDAFVCDVLLPAVRANGSLLQLSCTSQRATASAAAKQALAEAEALVAQRTAGR